MRFVLIAALVTLIACRPTLTRPAPIFLVTVTPINVGVGPGALCIAVDTEDPMGVWWWEPGRLGCSSRSTGPGVFRALDARVAARSRSATIDVYFRLQLITGPREGPRFAEVRLAVQDADIRVTPSGAQVKIERRHDLDIPEG